MRFVHAGAALIAVGVAVWLAGSSGGLRAIDTIVKRDRETVTAEYCIRCGTDRHTTELGRGKVHLGRSTKLSPSLFYSDFLDESHEHTWVLNCVTTQFADGRSSIGCGMNGFPNDVVMQYDDNEQFRVFVRARLAAGRLQRDAVARFASLPDLDGESSDAAQARSLLDAFPGNRR